MTDQPKADEPSAAPAGHRHRPVELLEERAEKSFFQLIPRRDLTKIALLILVLVVVVMLQRRSGSIVQSLTRTITAPTPTQAQPREAPRVKLAPAPR